MRVRPRYKQTEVGVIPEEWEVTHLGAHGATYGGLTGKTKTDFGTGEARFVPFMNVMSNVVIDCDAFERVHVAPSESQNCVLQHDLLFNGSSETPEEVALCSVQLAAIPNLFLNSFCFGYHLRDRARIDALFLAHLFRSRTGRKFVKALAQGSTRYNISKKALLTAPLSLPPLPEQRAIATALSDVDALLDGLERLIAKKRDLKQAAMQQLLTGQTRLPGFSAKWVARPLGQVGDIKSGGTPSTTQAHFWDGGVPWCTPTDITGLHGRKYLIDTARTISTAGLQFSSAEVIPPRSLIMTSRATIGECAINLVPVTTNQGFKSIVTFAEIDGEFLYYLMTTQKTSLVALCAGSTFLEIGKKQLSGYMIKLPKDRVEQEAIAAVLADMDAELAALETRRDKTHDLKQAMMQELLTGKTRLVAVGGAHA